MKPWLMPEKDEPPKQSRREALVCVCCLGIGGEGYVCAPCQSLDEQIQFLIQRHRALHEASRVVEQERLDAIPAQEIPEGVERQLREASRRVIEEGL